MDYDTDAKNYLVTTAISYPNGKPHIGHMYEAILSDIIARLFVITGKNAKLLTGTDEHGKKIQQTAILEGLTPKELCDKNSKLFVDMLSKIQVNYERFIRTTDEDHISLVKDSIVKSSGDIESSVYSGYYNVREETFVTETEANLTDFKDPASGIPLEFRSEPTYNFQLSKYKDYILANLHRVIGFNTKSFTDRINDLQDLSITRVSTPDFNWGIEFPLDPTHIVYVWFDALNSYYTGRKSIFGDDPNVTTIHVIGKDIVWFHSVILPAVLKSCGYHIYDEIFVHGFILDEKGNKMSKSLNNVISPDELLSEYSIDFIRFYLFMESGCGNDIKFSKARLESVCNDVLVNGFYNLFHRFYKLISDIDDYPFSEISSMNYEDMSITSVLNFDTFRDSLVQKLNVCNDTITMSKPWEMVGEDKSKFMCDFGVIFYSVLLMMSVVIPDKVKELNSYLGFKIPGITYDHEVTYKYIPGLKTFQRIKKIK